MNRQTRGKSGAGLARREASRSRAPRGASSSRHATSQATTRASGRPIATRPPRGSQPPPFGGDLIVEASSGRSPFTRICPPVLRRHRDPRTDPADPRSCRKLRPSPRRSPRARSRGSRRRPVVASSRPLTALAEAGQARTGAPSTTISGLGEHLDAHGASSSLRNPSRSMLAKLQSGPRGAEYIPEIITTVRMRSAQVRQQGSRESEGAAGRRQPRRITTPPGSSGRAPRTTLRTPGVPQPSRGRHRRPRSARPRRCAGGTSVSGS